MSEFIGDRGSTIEVDLFQESKAKSITQCDNCKTSIDLKTPKAEKGKDGKKAATKPNPALQATLDLMENGQNQEYHFCDLDCLFLFLSKRRGDKKSK
jgi:hypothetical protein